jgi:RNase E specificity factor CsrD
MQPVILFTYIALILLGIYLIQYKFRQLLLSRIGLLDVLEQWQQHGNSLTQTAASLTGDNKKNDPVINRIINIEQQLETAKQSDSHIEQLIRQRALLDSETGIGNREFFNNRLNALLCEESPRGAVLLIQLNEADFNLLDQPEREALQLLEMTIQGVKHRLENTTSYFLARQSDYELALLIPNIYVDETEKLATKLITTFKNIPLPQKIKKEEFIHIGISCFQHYQAVYEVLSEADMALRTAQLQGPSQWVIYDSKETEIQGVKGSLRWRTLLQWAIDNFSIETFYQPAIASNSDKILHHEALAKIKDKHGQYIPARVFLPMAKKCGFSEKIDTIMFDLVWQKLQYKNFKTETYSVNISIDSIQSDAFMHYICSVLQQNTHVAQRLIIEMGEYRLAQRLEQLLPRLKQLTALGVKLLVDRAGQYVVNAGYLKSGVISFVKLDHSIVLDIAKKPENQLFIQSLKALCDVQKVQLYALGVENFEEWQTLKKLGVSGGQGHYFTSPIQQLTQVK